MKNSNIIISVIIVLCIAAGVTAYGLTNSESNIFSLPGFTPSDDSAAIGADGLNNSNSSSSNGNGNGDNGNTNGGGSNNPNSNGNNNEAPAGISSGEAKNIATSRIGQTGWYAGTPSKMSNGNWIVPIYDQNGERAAGAEIDSKGNFIGIA